MVEACATVLNQVGSCEQSRSKVGKLQRDVSREENSLFVTDKEVDTSHCNLPPMLRDCATILYRGLLFVV